MADENTNQQRRGWGVFVPLIAFLGLAIVFAIMLTREGRDTNALPSALIGQLAPTIELPPVDGLIGQNGELLIGLEPNAFFEKITLVNVWASWCAPCRQEHPLLMELAKDDRFKIVGINYKDKAENAKQFLGSLGNPYDGVGVDNTGRAAIEWGVYGVPETFLVGPYGTIVYKHTGPLTADIIKRNLMPEIEKLVTGG